jgi:hypothetical protein
VLLDDVVGQRQAEAGALANRLGGVEGFEDALQDSRRHAAPGVADLDPGGRGVAAGAHGDGAALLDGMRGIDQQVHHHLVDLCGDTRHLGQLAEFAHHLGLVLQFVPDHIQRAFDAGVEVGFLPFRLVHVGKVLEVGDDLLDPLQAVAGFAHQVVDVGLQVIEIGGDEIGLAGLALRLRSARSSNWPV